MRPSGQCTASRAISTMLTFVLALFLVPGAAFAQVETGQISGTVTDPQGAVITGATVTVSSKDTGATRTVKTSDDGGYNVTNLQPGNYEVKVEGAGFGTKTIPAQVSVGTATTRPPQQWSAIAASEAVRRPKPGAVTRIPPSGSSW